MILHVPPSFSPNNQVCFRMMLTMCEYVLKQEVLMIFLKTLSEELDINFPVVQVVWLMTLHRTIHYSPEMVISEGVP